LLGPPRLPRHPLALARFGWRARRSARGLAERRFQSERARALFAGLAAHSMLPLEQPPTAAFGLVLGVTAHTVGWPFPRGGAQKIAGALASYLCALGGQISTGTRVESLADLPSAQVILCDVTPQQLLHLAGQRLPTAYQRKLERYRFTARQIRPNNSLSKELRPPPSSPRLRATPAAPPCRATTKSRLGTT
jgi:phytoene dehydrogenase-like protein